MKNIDQDIRPTHLHYLYYCVRHTKQLTMYEISTVPYMFKLIRE
jgi:hypothetical protein